MSDHHKPTTDPASALDRAIGTDHPCQDYSGCDITRARAEGFVYTAAWLLIGAAENPAVDRVLAEHHIELYPFPADLTGWLAFTDRHGVRCPACGHYDYRDDGWTPDRCSGCGTVHQPDGITATDRRELTRMDETVVSPARLAGETGFDSYAREVAVAVCHAAGGDTWHAVARSPMWPSTIIDQRIEITVVVGRLRIVVTQTTPAQTSCHERWTITVNTRPIPHRVFAGEVPHTAASIARSVWRHIHAVEVDPCDHLLCRQPATVATWRSSTCPAHAR